MNQLPGDEAFRKVLGPEQNAVLILEDGTVFLGRGFGAGGTVSGEVVFNTGMVGYPESLTDPSYCGQILVQTWPLVGNYWVPRRDLVDESGIPLHFESDSIKVTGCAVAEAQARPSHRSSRSSLPEWLKESGIPGISGIDTRELTKRLRTSGTMLGLTSVGPSLDLERLKQAARSLQDPNSTDLVGRVSTSQPGRYKGGGPTVVVIDCGMKFGILRNLLARGFNVVQVLCDTGAEEVGATNPSGVVISNGPGDPALCRSAIKSVRSLLETDLPLVSTGEVACFGKTFHEAFLKSLLASGFRLPKRSILLSTGPPKTKQLLLPTVRKLDALGFELCATGGTARFLKTNGVETTFLHWPMEKLEPNVSTFLSQRKVDLVINIPKSFEEEEVRNDYLIRRRAIEFGIPIITNAELATTLVSALERSVKLGI